MADATQVAVAKAVTDVLAAATGLEIAISPERSYADWDLDLKEEGNNVRVDVVAIATNQSLELLTRGLLAFDIAIHIAIRQRITLGEVDDDTGRLNTAAIDRLVLLTQQIAELLTRDRLSAIDPTAAFIETRIVVCPVKRHLREHRQFTSVIRVTFRVAKVKGA